MLKKFKVANNNSDSHKYSIIKSITKPVELLTDNLIVFTLLALVFAFGILIFAFLFGQTYVCHFNPVMRESLYCPETSYLYLPYIIIKTFLLAVCVYLWCANVFQRQQINEDIILKSYKEYGRIFLILWGFVLINILPAVSGYLLISREPNPVWQIELIYFTIVSLGFVIPFLLMIFYGLIADVIAGNGLKNLKIFWIATSGNGVKIVISTCIVFLICLVLLVFVNNTFQATSKWPAQLFNVVAELSFNAVTFLITVIMVNYMQVQKEILGVK